MAHFEHEQPAQERLTIEQLLEYRDLMVRIVRGQGKDIRYSVHYGSKVRTRPNTEYLLPCALTEWSQPGYEGGKTRIERDRTYTASLRRMGEGAGRLLVIESESKLSSENTYHTSRNAYAFAWDTLVGVYEAKVLPTELFSSAQTDFEVVTADELGVSEIAIFDHENTAASTENGEYEVFENPFSDTKWNAVSATDFAELVRRTTEYGRDYDDAHPVYKPAE